MTDTPKRFPYGGGPSRYVNPASAAARGFEVAELPGRATRTDRQQELTMETDQKVTDAIRAEARARAERARRGAIARTVAEALNTPLRARLLARMRSVDVEFSGEGVTIVHPTDASRRVQLVAANLVASHLYGLRSPRVVVTGTGRVLDDAGQPFGQVRHDWPLPDALAADVLLFAELNGG